MSSAPAGYRNPTEHRCWTQALILLLMLSCGLDLPAQSLLLIKPDGQSVSLPMLASGIRMDARSGDIEVSPRSASGQTGDGWCPSASGPTPATVSPALVLVLSDGRRYRIALSSSTVPSWRPSQQRLEVRTLGAQGQPGDGWCPAIPANAPSFVQALQASPSSLVVGGSTRLSWQTQGASSCSSVGSSYPTGVGSVAGWQLNMPVQSTGTSLSLLTAGSYRFRLTCTGTGGSVSSEVAVQVSPPPTGHCTGNHAPPSGRSRQTSFVLSASDLWLASNTDWPRGAEIDLTRWQPPLPSSIDAQGVNRSFLGRFGRDPGDTGTLELKNGFYAAFEVNTSGYGNRAGQLSWEQAGSLGAPVLVTLSPCPGDFFPTDARCKSNGSAISGIGWSTGANVPNYCPLSVGQTYYLNLIFGSPTQPGQSTCGFTACRWLFSQGCQLGCSP